jgi:4-amino-4-deoxy-L-arabinose transferase-like glycosyltransferase
MALAALVAWPMHGWAWRVKASERSVLDWLRLLGWFCWPAWPLAAWSLWRWRSHLMRRHLSVPLLASLVPLLTSLLMGADDRAMLLALPPLAVLASFALPTFQRSASALLDWFSVFFFTAGAIFLWLYYTALQVGWPAKFLANVRKLAQGYEPEFSLLTFVLALLGTLAWLWLVRWRTARHRHAIWKSLALPAGGVALAWLLAMTLGLHPLNYARSNKPLVDRIAAHVPRNVDCIAAPSLPTHALAALEFQGHWRVDATQNLAATACSIAISVQAEGTPTPPSGWKVLGVVRRPTDRFATYLVMQKDR